MKATKPIGLKTVPDDLLLEIAVRTARTGKLPSDFLKHQRLDKSTGIILELFNYALHRLGLALHLYDAAVQGKSVPKSIEDLVNGYV